MFCGGGVEAGRNILTGTSHAFSGSVYAYKWVHVRSVSGHLFRPSAGRLLTRKLPDFGHKKAAPVFEGGESCDVSCPFKSSNVIVSAAGLY